MSSATPVSCGAAHRPLSSRGLLPMASVRPSSIGKEGEKRMRADVGMLGKAHADDGRSDSADADGLSECFRADPADSSSRLAPAGR
mmetsp:Transcript_88794/g.246661  ORF Transcript_88794/g.246661 Transcript_88794/m.246661 type:complete len:86 (-) Transcript_88794:177-434(-)